MLISTDKAVDPTSMATMRGSPFGNVAMRDLYSKVQLPRSWSSIFGV
jgi:hypothetical protein